MDARKLIQHGASSLTMSLPSKWLKAHGLTKGDILFVEEEGNRLLLSTEKSIEMGRKTIDITDIDRTSTLLYVQSLYRFGYDEIEIRFTRPSTTHYRTGKEVTYSSIIHYAMQRCIGYEVVEQTEKRILVKQLTKETREDFKMVMRRIFRLLTESATSLYEGMEKGDRRLIAATEELHDNVTKFISFALRLLNKFGHPDVKQTSFYYHIIASLDKIMDILKYNARDLLDYKKEVSADCLRLWKQVNESLSLYYDLFYTFEMVKIDKLSRMRDAFKQELRARSGKLPREELYLLTNMKHILEILLDLTDFRMGLEY